MGWFYMAIGIILWQTIILICYVITQNKRTTLLLAFSFVYFWTLIVIKIVQWFEDIVRRDEKEC